MYRLLTFFIALIPFLVSAQELKKYDGPYTNGMAKSGKAVYTYYTDQKSREEVKHGDFRYDLRLSDQTYRFSQAFRGQYERGLKSGEWMYRNSKRDYFNREKKLYETGNTTLTANYRQGFPHGRWLYQSTSRARSLKTVNGQKRWGKHTQSIKTTIIANFVKGVLTDSFLVIIEPGKELRGYFDSRGFFHGTWTDHTAREDHVIYYEHGVKLSYSEIDLNMNKVIDRIEYTVNQQRLESLLQTGGDPNKLRQLPFTTDTISDLANKDSEIYKTLKKYIFNENDFLYRYITGDYGYYYDESGYRFLFGIKGANKVEFVHQITPAQKASRQEIISLENQIASYARRANKWKLTDKIQESDQGVVTLLRNKLKEAQTFACISNELYKAEDIPSGLEQAAKRCQANQLIKNDLPVFKTKQEYLDHIVLELERIKGESKPYYEQLKRKVN